MYDGMVGRPCLNHPFYSFRFDGDLSTVGLRILVEVKRINS